MNSYSLLILTLLIPIIGLILILLSRKNPNLRDLVTITIASLLFIVNLMLTLNIINTENSPSLILGNIFPGISLHLKPEPLGLLFGLIASGLWVVTSIYSIGYMRGKKEDNQTRFYCFFALAIGSTMGVAYAGNLLTLFIFYEALSLSTYPLVTHHQNENAKKGGRTYLGVLLTTSVIFFLFGVIWVWFLSGTTEFVSGGVLAEKISPFLTGILLLLFVFGIGKAGVMPFHRWLPAAMVAPTPVSALLHAVAVVKAGVFSVLKITVYTFGIENLSTNGASQFAMYIAAITIVTASIIALKQTNIKKMLAYSTVSQLSYIVLASMLANASGILGGTLHIASHAFGKITLFFCAGAIYVASGKTEINQLKGIAKAMPWTMTAFVIGAFSIIGLPPTGGFISKWYILLGSIENEEFIILIVLIVSTILSAAYLLPIIYFSFFALPIENIDHSEAPTPILIALAISVLLTFALFFYPDPIFNLAKEIGI